MPNSWFFYKTAWILSIPKSKRGLPGTKKEEKSEKVISKTCWTNKYTKEIFKVWCMHVTLGACRAWVSAALLSVVQNGALFFESARWAPLNFSKRSARWAPFTKIGERERKTRSFLALFLIPLCLWNFLKIEIFHSFIVFKIYFFNPLYANYCI